MKNYKLLIFCVVLMMSSMSLFATTKMPGEYLKPRAIDKILNDIDFLGSLKDGDYEVYSIVNLKNDIDTMKFSIHKYENSDVLKWFELTLNTFEQGKVTTKILTDKGVLTGKLKRLQLKYSKYYPFELDLKKNKALGKELTEAMIKKDGKKLLTKEKFLRNDRVKVGKTYYPVKVYEVKNGKKRVEYALLDKKDAKILGLAYLKEDGGPKFYLKELGTHAISVFPKKVPIIDLLSKMTELSKGFVDQEQVRKKALEKEKKMEDENLDKDDPILKLNKMLEEESE